MELTEAYRRLVSSGMTVKGMEPNSAHLMDGDMCITMSWPYRGEGLKPPGGYLCYRIPDPPSKPRLIDNLSKEFFSMLASPSIDIDPIRR